jgi:flavin reductase (DIM6/NTAB) family NADH-FMN oxidoreductase RutF
MSITPDEFREALAHWASGVTIVACRVDGRVVATTVSAFMSLSLRPPLVMVALGPNATVLPFLQPGTPFGISILGDHQRRLASVFADSFPVGASPFPPEGTPVVPDSLVALECTVSEITTGGDHTLVFAAVSQAVVGGGPRPLLRFRRRYHTLDG